MWASGMAMGKRWYCQNHARARRATFACESAELAIEHAGGAWKNQGYPASSIR
jgi:hypothetical protein